MLANNVGLIEAYDGEFEAAIRDCTAARKINPEFALSLLGIALGQIGLDQVTDAKATYEALAKMPQGAIMAGSGLASVALYEGRAADARTILTKAIDEALKQGDPDSAAKKLAMLAEAELALGHPPAARAAAIAR